MRVWENSQKVMEGDCHCASFCDLLLSFFTSFSSPLPNFLTLISHFTCSRTTTRQQNMMVLVQRPSNTRWPIVLCHNETSVLTLRDQLPHYLQQATLLRCLPGSQYLLFPPELDSHLSQLPQSQRARLRDDDHEAKTNRDGRML